MKKLLNVHECKTKRIFYLVITSFILIPLTISESYSKNIDDNYYQLYLEVVQGQKKIEQLTPQEKAKVLEIHQLTKNSCGNLRGKCERVCRAANSLKESSSDLARCANRHDYGEDCRSKYNNVRNDFDSYEYAVNEASGNCS